MLWRLSSGHPNPLVSWSESEKSQIAAGGSYAHKPIYSRGDGNITISDGQNNAINHTDGNYADKRTIHQVFQPLPRFGDSYTFIDSRVADDEVCRMGIREGSTLITRGTSRFVPHYIAGQECFSNLFLS